MTDHTLGDNAAIQADILEFIHEELVAGDVVVGAGDDLLIGEGNEDHMNGGEGMDTLIGGNANDTPDAFNKVRRSNGRIRFALLRSWASAVPRHASCEGC